MRNIARLALLGAALSVLPSAAGAQSLAPAGRDLLTHAAASYYTLAEHGFTGARCAVTPDWTVVIGKPRSDPASQAGFAIFDALRFALSMDAKGNVRLDKQDTGSGRSAGQAQGIRQMFDGFDQEIGGFFGTWTLFGLHPVIPPPTQAGVAVGPRANGYRITYKEGDADVVMDTDRAGVVTRLLVTAPAFVSTIDPTFDRTPEGLILTRYVADYLPASGPGKTHLTADISYQTVNALRFPAVIRIDSVYDGQPAKILQTLSACQVTRSR